MCCMPRVACCVLCIPFAARCMLRCMRRPRRPFRFDLIIAITHRTAVYARLRRQHAQRSLASAHVCTRACMRVGVSPRGICSCLWTTRPRTHPFHAAQLAGVAKAVKWNSLSPSSSFSADYREMWSLPVRRNSAAALRSIASGLARLATPPHPTPPHPTPPHPTPPHPTP